MNQPQPSPAHTPTPTPTTDDISDSDLFTSSLKTLRVQHSLILTENTHLKTRLHNVQSENADLRLELKETRALLGEVMVIANKKNLSTSWNQPNAVAGPSKQPETTRERARSPSSHVAPSNQPETTQKRARYLSIEIIEPPKKSESTKPQSKVSVSVVSPNQKLHRRSYPTPTPSSNDAKRRRIDPEQRGVKSPAPSSSLSSCSSSTPSVVAKKETKPKYEGKVRVPESMIETYLSSSRPLPISPPPLLDLQVPRRFLRLAYGGSDQQFLQYIQKTRNPSGPTIRRIVFPMLDMNPAMPIQPGHAGLVFASRHEILSNGPWTVFCKPPETGKALWLYLGEYTNVLCGKMTSEQFGIQRDVASVKKEWAKLLLRVKHYDVYVSMRARIALRKAGVLPVDDADEEERLVKAEMDKVKANQGSEVTEEDIIGAFSRGDEGIDIIRMTCVKYDHVFADDIKAKFPDYSRMLLEKKQSGGVVNDEGEGEGEGEDQVPVRRARRRGKPMVCDEDEDEDDSGDYVDKS